MFDTQSAPPKGRLAPARPKGQRAGECYAPRWGGAEYYETNQQIRARRATLTARGEDRARPEAALRGPPAHDFPFPLDLAAGAP